MSLYIPNRGDDSKPIPSLLHMDTLINIWQYLSDKGKESDKNSVHSYIPLYDKILAPYKECDYVLEIGLFNGHSLRMWEYYFYNADVHGVDCSDTPHDGMADLRPMMQEMGHNISIFDASSAELVKKHYEGIKFDVIIEDAAHSVEQQLQMYSIFKDYLSPGGIYIIEDVQDLDKDRSRFENIDPEKTVEIHDRRVFKNRYDDVCISIK